MQGPPSHRAAPMGLRRSLLLAVLFVGVGAVRERVTLTVNPIRRVVTMLQMMQKKTTAEGKKEKELFDKFMCYCKTGGDSLRESTAAAQMKIPQLESDIDQHGTMKSQLASDVVQHRKDREAAEGSVNDATAIRDKEAAEFEQESSQSKSAIEAMTKAIAALEKGMVGGFLQTSAAAVLRRLVSSADFDGAGREALVSLLSAGQGQAEGYAPASGEIVGILKEMKEAMSRNLAEATSQEQAALKDYEGLMAAKRKEVGSLQESIEDKTGRLGNAKVELVSLSEDLEDTKQSLAADSTFLANLGTNCDTKQKQWEERSATRSDELIALSETIKILNADESLDLFKQTLPTPSLLQMQVSTKDVLKQARQALSRSAGRHHDYRIDLLSLALRGKKVNFDKVTMMIDDMIGLLVKEQTQDESKKDYCEKQSDLADDEKKALERKILQLGLSVEKSDEEITSLTEEIASLAEGIKYLDKKVAESTDIRKAEHAEYVEDLAASGAATEIIETAKQRLLEFYNPKLAKASFASVHESAPSLVQLAARGAADGVPAPPPETWAAYQKKGGESTGVIAMMDSLMRSLAKEHTEMKVEEKDAQAEYERLIGDSAEKRAADSRALSQREAVKADAEAEMLKSKDEKKVKTAEAYSNDKYIYELHTECDWLIKNFEMRKEARAGEVDSLKKAKAVLSGADYSLVQTARRHLRTISRA